MERRGHLKAQPVRLLSLPPSHPGCQSRGPRDNGGPQASLDLPKHRGSDWIFGGSKDSWLTPPRTVPCVCWVLSAGRTCPCRGPPRETPSRGQYIPGVGEPGSGQVQSRRSAADTGQQGQALKEGAGSPAQREGLEL